MNLNIGIRKSLFLLISLFMSSVLTAQYQIGQSLYGDSSTLRFGGEVSLSGDGEVMATSGSGSGVKIYKQSQCAWVEDVVITGDGIGDAVLSNNGKRVVIGVPGKGAPSMGDAGAVYVFDNINDDWELVGSPIIGQIFNARFGHDVSISGDGKIIACDYSYAKERDGRTRIFELINNNWVQIGDDIVGENTDDARSISGRTERLSLSYDGTIVAIGSAGGDENGEDAGHVRIFKNMNNSWNQLGVNILGTKGAGKSHRGDNFGSSVSLSHQGTIIAIGAPQVDAGGEFGNGQVKIFEFKDTSWSQVGQPINGDYTSHHIAKCAISSNGSIIAIGNDDWDAPVNVYRNINSVWTKIVEPINGDAQGDYFGRSVSLSDDGSILAIGAPQNDFNGNDAGQVKVFNVRNVINTITECDSYTWTDGVIYNESNNTAKDTFVNLVGCDSVVTLNLTITNVNAGVANVDESTLRAQAAEPGTTYQWLNCADFEPIPGETNATFTSESSGKYAVDVTFNDCVKRSECYTIKSSAGLNSFHLNNKVKLYPNPTTNNLTISLEGIAIVDLIILDIQGKVILQKSGLFDNDCISLSSLESGIYFAKIMTPEFSKEIRVIKQ
jgi:hypothetical protein|tara:strand:+ start:1374 stop:3203 length:1830 start_codon:yes stop_codon:yes gene_type:complete